MEATVLAASVVPKIGDPGLQAEPDGQYRTEDGAAEDDEGVEVDHGRTIA